MLYKQVLKISEDKFHRMLIQLNSIFYFEKGVKFEFLEPFSINFLVFEMLKNQRPLITAQVKKILTKKVLNL